MKYFPILFLVVVVILIIGGSFASKSKYRPAPTTDEEAIRQLSDDTGYSMDEIRKAWRKAPR